MKLFLTYAISSHYRVIFPKIGYAFWALGIFSLKCAGWKQEASFLYCVAILNSECKRQPQKVQIFTTREYRIMYILG